MCSDQLPSEVKLTETTVRLNPSADLMRTMLIKKVFQTPNSGPGQKPEEQILGKKCVFSWPKVNVSENVLQQLKNWGNWNEWLSGVSTAVNFLPPAAAVHPTSEKVNESESEFLQQNIDIWPQDINIFLQELWQNWTPSRSQNVKFRPPAP